DAGAVRRDCEALAKGEGKPGTFTSLGLGGVVATQLWHNLYLGGGLCEELPPLEFPHAAKPVAAAQPAPLAGALRPLTAAPQAATRQGPHRQALSSARLPEGCGRGRETGRPTAARNHRSLWSLPWRGAGRARVWPADNWGWPG